MSMGTYSAALDLQRLKVPGVPLCMSKMHSENLDLTLPNGSLAADIFLRQEPDEGEEEDEDDGKEKEDDDEDDTTDDGYSE
jgi:hypothetical protein